MEFIDKVKWSRNPNSYSNNIILRLHKKCLPSDPFFRLTEKYQNNFYMFAKKNCLLYFGSYNFNLVAMGCLFKLFIFPNSKKKKVIFSILFYIFIDKEFHSKSLGSFILNQFLDESNFILLVTKEETFQRFYIKFKNYSFSLFGRRLVCLRK